jgi:ABC-type multidrug transport system permease subunit
VVESDVWGRDLFRQTFEGPWGVSRMRWLALVFLGLVIASALLGWVATSVAHGPIAPAVAAVIVLLTVLVVGFTAGLSGPPRTSLYGLTLGILLVAIAAALRSPPPLVVRSDLAARSANTDA